MITNDPPEQVAASVLQQRLDAVAAEITHALNRSIAAHAAVIDLIRREEALRVVLGMVADEPAFANTPARTHDLGSRLDYRLERLLVDLRMAARERRIDGRSEVAASDDRSPRPHHEPTGEHAPNRTPAHDEGANAEGTTPSFSNSSSPLDVQTEAIEVAQESGGVVQVRELAARIREVEPGRFRNARSAYSSVYAQLERSERFVKGGRGQFVLKQRRADRDRPPGARDRAPGTIVARARPSTQIDDAVARIDAGAVGELGTALRNPINVPSLLGSGQIAPAAPSLVVGERHSIVHPSVGTRPTAAGRLGAGNPEVPAVRSRAAPSNDDDAITDVEAT